MHSEGKGSGSTFFIELPVYRKVNTSYDSAKLASKLETIQLQHDNNTSTSTSNNRLYDECSSNSFSFSPSASPTRSTERFEDSTFQRPVQGLATRRIPHQQTEKEKKLVILMVDDSYANRKMLTRLLVRDGHTVVEAGDGIQAINIIYHVLHAQEGTRGDIEQGLMDNQELLGNIPQLKREPPIEITDIERIDLVLMDNFMIEMNGPEAAKLMRIFGFSGPILGVTGSLDDAASRFLSCGADVILQKPIDVKGIWKTLHSIKFFSGHFHSPKCKAAAFS